jgi:predicted nuclease with TOPRIM domain
MKINNSNIEYKSYLNFEKYNERLNNLFCKNSFLQKMKCLLPDNYQDIKDKMFRYKKSGYQYELNREMLAILNEIEKKENSMNMLINKVMNYYTQSRDNFVSLLFQ